MRIPKISDSNTLKIFDVSKKPVRLKVLRNCHAKCFSHRDIKKLSNESSVEGSNEMDPNSKGKHFKFIATMGFWCILLAYIS